MFFRTISSLPFPVSFTLNPYASCSPVSCSVKVRNAWCGFFPLRPSVVVRTILRVSAALRVTAEESGEVAESLVEEGDQSNNHNLSTQINLLLLDTSSNSGSLALNGQRCIFEGPRACCQRCRGQERICNGSELDESHCDL